MNVRAGRGIREMENKDLTAASESAQFDLVIEPGRSFRHYWRDLWQYRELFYFLSWRDILVMRKP